MRPKYTNLFPRHARNLGTNFPLGTEVAGFYTATGMKEVSFKAPWGAPLILMTAVCTMICLILPLPGLFICYASASALREWGLSTIPDWAGYSLIVAPLAAIFGSALFMVRGYVLTDTSLIIKRLGWNSRFDLSRLISAAVNQNALEKSLRLFGNGGFFSFTGLFRNKTLGNYRAYATDVKKAVVLRFSDKTVVVTPDDPQKFVAEINL